MNWRKENKNNNVFCIVYVKTTIAIYCWMCCVYCVFIYHLLFSHAPLLLRTDLVFHIENGNHIDTLLPNPLSSNVRVILAKCFQYFATVHSLSTGLLIANRRHRRARHQRRSCRSRFLLASTNSRIYTIYVICVENFLKYIDGGTSRFAPVKGKCVCYSVYSWVYECMSVVLECIHGCVRESSCVSLCACTTRIQRTLYKTDKTWPVILFNVLWPPLKEHLLMGAKSSSSSYIWSIVEYFDTNNSNCHSWTSSISKFRNYDHQRRISGNRFDSQFEWYFFYERTRFLSKRKIE